MDYCHEVHELTRIFADLLPACPTWRYNVVAMPFLHLNQQQLFYTRRPWLPNKTAPALILVHGAGGSHLDWPAQLRQMDGVTVYGLDLPGHGRSERPGRSSIDAYADDVTAFAEILELGHVIVAGHSMGGAIALTMALRRPDWLAGLVLAGTGARLRVADAILNQILPHFETTIDTISRYYWAESTAPALVEAGRQALRQNDPDILYHDYLACNAFDVLDRLGEIEVPALIVSGTADRLTPVKYGRYLADQIRHSHFVILEDAAHMMALEQPEAVAKAVQSFIKDVVT
jgi:pimeloyl-ACP methyl ester carboxylesterase